MGSLLSFWKKPRKKCHRRTTREVYVELMHNLENSGRFKPEEFNCLEDLIMAAYTTPTGEDTVVMDDLKAVLSKMPAKKAIEMVDQVIGEKSKKAKESSKE